MAADASASILSRLTATLDIPMYLGTAKMPHKVEQDLTLTNGTGANQVNMAWSDGNGSVAAAAFDNLNLSSLAQLDEDGGTVWTVIFTKVKGLIIRNKSTSGYLRVGGGTDGVPAADAWVGAAGEGWLTADADKIDNPAGGCLLLTFPPAAGVAVGAGNNILCLGGVTATQTYDIEVVGIGTAS